MKKNLKIAGPLHPLNVKLQTVKTLTKKFETDKTMVIHGLWDKDLNTIYIATDLPEDQKLHTFFTNKLCAFPQLPDCCRPMCSA